MKYKIGDKVKIKSWEQMANEFEINTVDGINCNHIIFAKGMREYCEKVVTIHNVIRNLYIIKEDAGIHVWTDDMIDCLVSDEIAIDIKYHADIQHLEKIEQGDWIDLRSAEDVTMMLGEYKMINLGVAMQLPEGYEAHVAPRSSTFKNFGIILVNGIGIIDNSYCGDNDIWRFPALCLKQEGTVIKKGDRIAQFRIIKKQPEISFKEVEHLEGMNRGGIGSTGVN